MNNVADIAKNRPQIYQDIHERDFTRNIHRFRIGVPVPIHQWKISFSGDDRSMHLYDFLFQVEVLRRSENLVETKLLKSIVLLSGRARLWYYSNYENFNTWNELVGSLKAEFLPQIMISCYYQTFLTEPKNHMNRLPNSLCI